MDTNANKHKHGTGSLYSNETALSMGTIDLTGLNTNPSNLGNMNLGDRHANFIELDDMSTGSIGTFALDDIMNQKQDDPQTVKSTSKHGMVPNKEVATTFLTP